MRFRINCYKCSRRRTRTIGKERDTLINWRFHYSVILVFDRQAANALQVAAWNIAIQHGKMALHIQLLYSNELNLLHGFSNKCVWIQSKLSRNLERYIRGMSNIWVGDAGFGSLFLWLYRLDTNVEGLNVSMSSL